MTNKKLKVEYRRLQDIKDERQQVKNDLKKTAMSVNQGNSSSTIMIGSLIIFLLTVLVIFQFFENTL